MESAPSQWSPKLRKFWRQDIARPRAPKFRHRAKMDPPTLTSPLSELTQHLTHIPIRDMEDWVRRPIEVRRHQVSEMSGKVARPMNSFLLYRSAYADRTKKWVSKNNHQVVSQLAGKSWKLETVDIRKNMSAWQPSRGIIMQRHTPAISSRQRSRTSEPSRRTNGPPAVYIDEDLISQELGP